MDKVAAWGDENVRDNHILFRTKGIDDVAALTHFKINAVIPWSKGRSGPEHETWTFGTYRYR